MSTFYIVATRENPPRVIAKASDSYFSEMSDKRIVAASGADNEQALLELPEGVDENFLKVVDDGLGNGLDSLSLTTDTQAKETAAWAALRKARNEKLLDCDEARNYMIWAEYSDTPWGQGKKDNWRLYRQALLELPENTTDVLSFDYENDWPVKPQL